MIEPSIAAGLHIGRFQETAYKTLLRKCLIDSRRMFIRVELQKESCCVESLAQRCGFDRSREDDQKTESVDERNCSLSNCLARGSSCHGNCISIGNCCRFVSD